MKESLNNVFTYCCLGLMGLAVAIQNLPQIKTRSAIGQTTEPTPLTSLSLTKEPTPPLSSESAKSQRTLSLSITVDNPSFLKVKQGDEITIGEIITDDTIERERLRRSRASIDLQLQNLKSKPIPKPEPPRAPKEITPIPRANYAEELANIAQAEMKLAQAQLLLKARTSLLQSDNPERRAEAEKSEAALQLATQKVEEQQQLLQAFKDRNIKAAPIIEHESAKLKQLESELEQAKSGLEQARAKLNAAGIEQQQQLQSLQLGVRLQESELELAKSRLQAAHQRRQYMEYAVSVDAVELRQKFDQLKQDYSRSEQIYAQAVRDRDYQLAQLSLSLAAVDEKLSQIPVVRSPKNGYIRRIKPWVGVNGRYTTTLTISSSPAAKSNGGTRADSFTRSFATNSKRQL